MLPSLFEKDEVITLSYLFSIPKEGDIVVFQHIFPPFIFCKRITKIINNKIWVEGDNKKESVDSRRFGYINRKDIIGKVMFKI